jgi:hypothetical protein
MFFYSTPLIDSLGLAEATRFLLQYQKGTGNYTKERKELLKRITINDIVEPYKKVNK